MAEQQLIDYIKKAKEAGQSDDQSRTLLYNSGWTESEVSDAFKASNQSQIKPQVQTQPQAAYQSKVEAQPQVSAQPNSFTATQSKPQVAYQPKVEAQPQPQTAYQPTAQAKTQSPAISSQNNMPRMRKGSHILSKILIGLVIIVVLGGVAFVSAKYLNLPWFSSRPSPETVISKMMANMQNVKSSHVIMQLHASATSSDSATPQGNLSFDTNSEIDMTDANNPKADGNFTINLTMPGSSSPIASASADAEIIGSTYYIKINSLVIPSDVSAPGLDISQVQGKWFKIDQDSIKALSQAGAGQTANIDVSQINSADFGKKIQNLVAAENMLSFTQQLNDETVGGQDTYHYLITVSKTKINDLVSKIITLAEQESSTGAAGSSNELVVNMANAFAKTFVDSVGDINMEMWIGKKDYLLYEVKLDKAIDLSKAIPGVNTLVDIKFNTTNSNFNKVITVQAPLNAQKIETVLLPMLKVQQVNSDMSQIGFDAQSLFFTNKSYYAVCKNGFLAGSKTTSYGQDFIKIANDVIKQGAKNPACFAGLQDYCVSTQLADGTYLCIDKNNILGTVKCLSAKTVCQ